MRDLIAKANNEIKKVKAYILENEGAFDYMNLKLYDASMYDKSRKFPLCASDDTENNLFYEFCEESYDVFIEDMREKKIQFEKMQKFLGRTSYFRLQDYVSRVNGNIDWEHTIYTIMEDLLGDVDSYFSVDDYGMIMENSIDLEGFAFIPVDVALDEVKSDLEMIAKNLYKDFLKEVEDVIEVYNYISDFKKNQIAYFEDWLEYVEGSLAYEREQELKAENERLSIINRMPSEIRDIMKRCVYDKEDLEKICIYVC